MDKQNLKYSLLKELNQQQMQAVTLQNEHSLILAGAGSGKTRVLTSRIAWLLQTGEAGLQNILAVTFTNKAAREMTTRISSQLPFNTRGMWVGTFHGLANRFLRAHYQLANLPQNFQILDIQDQLSAIKRIYKQHNIDDNIVEPKFAQWFINGAKEEAKRPQDIIAKDLETNIKLEIYKLYQDQCEKEGVVDFAELLLRCFELFRDNIEVREHYRNKFKYILIDEFQDTNKLQYSWIRMFAHLPDSQLYKNAGASIMAVGDDDQSIYAFRGARIGNMSDFIEEYKVNEIIKLEENYRSSNNILEAANGLISNNTERLGKNLRTQSGDGEKVKVLTWASDSDEAAGVVDLIKQLIKTDKIDPLQIAVLYRNNAQSRIIEARLTAENVLYKVYGGLRFFERLEIKHALAYLRLMQNPHDDTSFLRVVNFPTRGIGAKTLEALQDSALSNGVSLYGATKYLMGKAKVLLDGFIAQIQVMKEQTENMPLDELTHAMLNMSGLIKHYENDRDGQDRLENLQELVNAVKAFAVNPINLDTNEIINPLDDFLTHAALEAGDNQAKDGQSGVQLMTVHSSKGLEFDAVFITGLEEGLFPHQNSFGDIGGEQEERRLMYVAITRARQHLYLSFAKRRNIYGQFKNSISSRFLREIPEEYLKWINAKNSEDNYWDLSINSNKSKSLDELLTVNKLAASFSKNDGELKIGTNVFHVKFGEGKVLAKEGTGDDYKVKVSFKRHGEKWLIASIAKLTIIDE